MTSNKSNIFQIWKIYQRRAESLAHYFDMNIVYYHYAWEEKSKFFKAASYILKSLDTISDLLRHRPPLVFLQLPPTPALYIVGLYCLITRTPYVVDCHNAMFMGWWIRWPFAKHFLRKASAVIVHNNEVQTYAEKYNIKTMVMRDPLPQDVTTADSGISEKSGLTPGKYVIVPWNMASDEPISEFIEAVRLTPEIKYAMTWFTERLPENLKSNLPENLIFTGYLEVDEFNDLFKNAGAAISLTTRKNTQPSAAAESIAFGVPLILSNFETARQLYSDVPLLVENTPKSISEGVVKIFRDHALYRDKVLGFKEILRKDLENEVALLNEKIIRTQSS